MIPYFVMIIKRFSKLVKKRRFHIIFSMDDEDLLLTETLEKIHAQLLEERKAITRTDEANSKVAAEYDDAILKLKKLLPQVNDVTALCVLEDDDFCFIIQLIEEYIDNFIIDGRTEEARKRDEAKYRALNDFLEQFYDDGEEDEEDEDNFEDEEE